MSHAHRRGLSLLEVLLALAILGMTLAVIAELVRIGGRNAEQARDISTAQIHCESVMAQLVSGLIAPTPVTSVPLDDPNSPGEWLYSIEVQPVDQGGLLAVKVAVSQHPDLFSRPVTFALGRWMVDPQVLATASSTLTDAATGTAVDSSTTSP